MADTLIDAEPSAGEFRRQQSQFRYWVGIDFPGLRRSPRAGSDRYTRNRRRDWR